MSNSITEWGARSGRLLWWPRKEMPVFLAMRAEERAKIRAEFERRQRDTGATSARPRRDVGATPARRQRDTGRYPPARRRRDTGATSARPRRDVGATPARHWRDVGATPARRRGGAREKVSGVRAKRQTRNHCPNLVSCVGWTPPTVSWFGAISLWRLVRGMF